MEKGMGERVWMVEKDHQQSSFTSHQCTRIAFHFVQGKQIKRHLFIRKLFHIDSKRMRSRTSDLILFWVWELWILIGMHFIHPPYGIL